MRFRNLGLVVAALALLGGTASAEERHRPFELGVFLGGHFFSSDSGLASAEGDPDDLNLDHGLAFGLRLGFGITRNFGFELEGIGVPTGTKSGAADMFVIGYRLSAVVHLIGSGTVRPFILAGWGGWQGFTGDEAVIPDDTDNLIHGGVGVKIALTPAILLRLDGRILFPPAALSGKDAGDIGTTEKGKTGFDFEALAGISFAFGGSEPPPPEEPPPPPEEPKDRDGDGIFDDKDACPDEPEDKDNFEDADGCPDPDNDKDGIMDADDKCPNDPEDKDGFQDDDGCPDNDNDGDTILDADDKCPNEPETKNGFQDADGCPDTVPAAVRRFTGVIQGIKYRTGSAEITRGSRPILDRAVTVLKEFPDVRIEIQGHTDNRGSAEFNKDLSQRRAESVRQYFINAGIDENRLTAVGYGFDLPIATNKTNAGRAKNRRTEFKLIE